MLILAKGKIIDSDDVPVMVLFTQEELEKFKAEPPNVDIKCSFPPEWAQTRGENWMNANREKVIKARDKAMRRKGNIAPTQIVQASPPPQPESMSDDEIRELLGGIDAEDIDFEDEQEGDKYDK